jgi:PAT family beta-lactamase induction signal transducer AmpG
MRLCEPSVAAAQFTIYMAIGNLGVSAGAWVLGQAGFMGLGGVFLAVAAWVALALLLMMIVPLPRRGDVYVPIMSFDSHVPLREHGGMA